MMTDHTSRKLTWKDYLVVASLLFGLFFGAGNLIFPLHLGQLAGANWGTAAVGFLITGVLLPLLSVLAVAITPLATEIFPIKSYLHLSSTW